MELLGVLLIAGAVFGICFLIDRGFTKLFRNQAQHMSGLSVRLNKKYGSFGLIFFILGIAALMNGIGENTLLAVGGGFIAVVGVGLVVYYMTFGIFYDANTFLLTTFGKKSKVYRYRDIQFQQLYNSYGNTVIELHLSDSRAVQLQASMEGAYPFLDKAFAAWCAQKGIREEDCTFHDPENSCWFPSQEEM